MEAKQERLHTFPPGCDRCEEYTGPPISEDGTVVLKVGEPTGCPVWSWGSKEWGNEGYLCSAQHNCKEEIKADNRTYQRLIKQERFKSFSRILKESPGRINQDTFNVLADFLLALKEKGKPGPKPDKVKQAALVENYEAKKKIRMDTDPSKNKTIKATARKAKQRMKDRASERTKQLGELLSLSNPKHPASQGLSENPQEH